MSLAACGDRSHFRILDSKKIQTISANVHQCVLSSEDLGRLGGDEKERQISITMCVLSSNVRSQIYISAPWYTVKLIYGCGGKYLSSSQQEVE